MSVNSSPTTNDSLHPHGSFNSSFPSFMDCFISAPSSFIFMVFVITYPIFLLPLCIFILYDWCQKSRTKPFSSSSAAMCHTDSFTYHAAIIKLIGISGCLVSFCGVCEEDLHILSVGVLLASFILHGEALFHVLTCVERYLAVVHPIVYRSLRNERGVRVRNISIGCAWLLCCGGTSLLMIENLFTIIDLCLLIMAIMIVSFCSISVLHILIRPGPGEQGGDRERVDQTKHRAFYTIVAILGVLVLRFAWGMARVLIYLLYESNNCIIVTCGFWFYLPSSLVLPVLFLHRRGKLTCWQK